jgi:regulator of protease activity HflC (stomatin/prohibitin superfamily)
VVVFAAAVLLGLLALLPDSQLPAAARYVLAAMAGLLLIKLIVDLSPSFFLAETIYEGYVGALYRDGKLAELLPPGRHLRVGRGLAVFPLDMRIGLLSVAGQESLTADGVPLRSSLLLQVRIADVRRHLSRTDAAAQLYGDAQLALREAIGSQEAEAIARSRPELNAAITAALSPVIEVYGYALERAEIRELGFSGEFKTVMARVVQSRIEGQAQLERSRGEMAALRNLANAARMLEGNPNLLALRSFQAAEAGARITLVLGTDSKGAISAATTEPASDQQE